jgi:hypothetical protein
MEASLVARGQENRKVHCLVRDGVGGEFQKTGATETIVKFDFDETFRKG